MHRLSIIIPVLGDLHKLEDTLVSVLENRPSNTETIVVFNRPYDDPYGLRNEISLLEAPRSSRLIDCIRFGIDASEGSIFHVLQPGVVVGPHWVEKVLPFFNDLSVAAAAPLLIDGEESSRVISAGLAYRAGGLAWRIGFGQSPDQAIKQPKSFFGPDLFSAFYRRTAYDAVGGFDPFYRDVLAAVDLNIAFQRAGYKCVSAAQSMHFINGGKMPLPTRLGSGKEAEHLFYSWAGQLGWTKAMAGHAVLYARELLESIVVPGNLLRLSGRAWESVVWPLRRPMQRDGVETSAEADASEVASLPFPTPKEESSESILRSRAG